MAKTQFSTTTTQFGSSKTQLDTTTVKLETDNTLLDTTNTSFDTMTHDGNCVLTDYRAFIERLVIRDGNFSRVISRRNSLCSIISSAVDDVLNRPNVLVDGVG